MARCGISSWRIRTSQAEEIAIPAYRVYYQNITKLWRDFGTVPTLFTDDLLRARAADAAIVGSPKRCATEIAAYFEESGLTIWYYRSRGAA